MLWTLGCQSPPPPQVTHVVICWLKHPGDAVDRQKLIDTSYKLRQIPGVMNVTAGRSIASTRPTVDSTYDVAVIFTFANEKALRAYEQNPLHKKAVSEVLIPLTAKVVIYDVKRGDASTKR